MIGFFWFVGCMLSCCLVGACCCYCVKAKKLTHMEKTNERNWRMYNAEVS